MNASSRTYLLLANFTKTNFGLTNPRVVSIVSKPIPFCIRTLRVPSSNVSASTPYHVFLKYERPLRLLKSRLANLNMRPLESAKYNPSVIVKSCAVFDL